MCVCVCVCLVPFLPHACCPHHPSCHCRCRCRFSSLASGFCYPPFLPFFPLLSKSHHIHSLPTPILSFFRPFEQDHPRPRIVALPYLTAHPSHPLTRTSRRQRDVVTPETRLLYAHASQPPQSLVSFPVDSLQLESGVLLLCARCSSFLLSFHLDSRQAVTDATNHHQRQPVLAWLTARRDLSPHSGLI